MTVYFLALFAHLLGMLGLFVSAWGCSGLRPCASANAGEDSPMIANDG